MAGDFGTIGMGALGGAGTGAALGTAIFPGIGTAIGAVGGALIGGIGANNKVNARDAAADRIEALPQYDPMQLNFLDKLQREKRSIESGFTTDFQVAKGLNQEALAGGLSVAGSVASTNPALALSMMGQANRGYNTGINQALGTISTRSGGYTQSIGQLINSVSQRNLDLQTYKATQQMGLASSDLQTSNTNNAQFAARLPQYTGEIGKGLGQLGGALGGIFGGGGPVGNGPQGINNPGFNQTMNALSATQVAPALSLPY